jgi:hypothetical protein
VLAAAALVGVLVLGVLVAGSTQHGATTAASSTAEKTVTPTPLEAAVIGADGRADTPEPIRSQLATVNAALEDCMIGHGATKQPLAGGGFAYDDPGTRAAAACKVVAVKAASVADSKKAQAANATRAAAQHAYGACVLNDPNATPTDVAPVAGSPAGVACRTLINAIGLDDGVLAAIVTATMAARPLSDGAHFTLTWAGRMTRDLAAPIVGLQPTRDATGAEKVVVVAFDGTFQAPRGPDGTNAARPSTLAYQFDAEGRISDYGFGADPFVPPDGQTLVATNVTTLSPKEEAAARSEPVLPPPGRTLTATSVETIVP